jgi:hypothetical protein
VLLASAQHRLHMPCLIVSTPILVEPDKPQQRRLDAFTALLGKCLADILRDAHAAGAAATPLLEEVLDQFHANAWAGVCHWLPRIGNPTRGGSWLHPS